MQSLHVAHVSKIRPNPDVLVSDRSDVEVGNVVSITFLDMAIDNEDFRSIILTSIFCELSRILPWIKNPNLSCWGALMVLSSHVTNVVVILHEYRLVDRHLFVVSKFNGFLVRLHV